MPFTCTLCQVNGLEKKFKGSKDLQKHVESVHEGIKYKCEQCDKSYADIFALRVHIKIAHSQTTVQMHKCQEPGCGREFQYPAFLILNLS